jgi:hypothetical protein
MKEIAKAELFRLQKLNRKRKLLPVAVVNAAKDANSPLHGYFEWNDGKAADQYRLSQARQLIASVTIISDGETSYPAFVSLSIDRLTGGYRATSDVLADDDLRRELLSTAMGELNAMKDRYRRISELASVIQGAAQGVEKLIEKTRNAPKRKTVEA